MGAHASIGEWALVYNLGEVIIGEKATVSHRAHLCAGTHEYTNPTLPLIRSTVQIEAMAWVCADAFVGPGVTVGAGAIVGAAAVVTRDVEPWTIVAGNPAKVIKKRVLKG
jgi:putative colanic acid biosynthesis acetyltransferase WcaF